MKFDLKTAIGSIAPTLATMLGGPLAGAAVGALAQAFGLSPSASQDDITKVVQAGAMTPDIIAKVREQDQKHAEIIGQQNIDLVKLNLDNETAQIQVEATDRDSARKMQIAQQSGIPAVLSVLITAGFFTILGFMMSGVKVEDNQAFLLLLGSLGTGWTTVMAYWFGTTRGSSEKNALLAQSTPSK